MEQDKCDFCKDIPRVCIQDWPHAQVHEAWFNYIWTWRNIEKCRQETELKIKMLAWPNHMTSQFSFLKY